MEDTSTIPAAVSPHVASLAKSFALVPPAAASAVVDCVLASSGLHPSDLFHSLLLALPDLHESSNSNQIVSHTAALCYLVKDDRTAPDALQLLIWRVFLPLLRAVNVSDSELLIQLEELLCDVVSNTRSLELAEATVVPFCLRSIGLSVGMFNNEELAVYQWSCDGLFNEDSGSESVALAALPLPIACCVLTSLLETALRSKSSQGPERELVNRFTSLESFAQNLIWDLSAMALGMLMQSPELRSCAVRLLLPHIFRSFHVVRLVKVSVEGSPHMLTRICFLRKIWKCCLSLFLLGRLERLDAYNTLSLCFSSFDNASGSANVLVDDSGEAFEIGEEKEFWEEIQRGLVDKDSSVRKQALYILKISLSHYFSSPASGYGQSSCVLEITSQKKNIQTILHDGTTSHAGVTKRGRWAEKEAKSLGVGEVFHFGDHCLTNQERWKVFLLLYEMLEEYGTHLVEAAWTHQVSLLFQYGSINNGLNPNTVGVYQVQMGSLEGIFSWLAILWERGLFHGNPQVRCLIMQSFLGIAWEKHEHYAQKVPMNFILGPFILGLNDVVQHKDFGVKGVYTSETIQGAMRYLCQLSCRLSLSERRVLVFKLASVVRQESFGRAGLMALAYCISSAACQSDLNAGSEVHDHNNNHPKPRVIKLEPTQENALVSSADLLDVLGIVMERSKQHFNSNYRSQVCKQVLKAAASMIGISDVPLDMLLHFLSIIPREFTDFAGPLRGMVQLWLSEVNSQDHTFGLVDTKMNILMNLTTFPTSFVKCRNSPERSLSFNDEDVGAWGAEAQRWARVLFLVTTKKQHLEPIFMFLKNHCSMLCDDGVNLDWVPIKLLILILCLVEEFEIAWRKYTFYKEARVRKSTDMASLLGQLDPLFTSLSADSFIQHCFLMLEDLLSFAKLSSQVFWSVTMVDMHLPCSIKGKLGGPSQRRLAPLTTSAVLQAIISVRTLSSISPWYTQLKRDDYLDSSFTFLWDFTWNVIQSSMCNTEFDAELCLAAYEALSHVFKAFSTAFTPFVFDLVLNHNKSSYPIVKDKALLDPLLFSFLESVNNILGGGLLKRSRRAVLLNWKWLCLDSLMLIPYNNIGKDAHLRSEFPFFSDSALQSTFVDIVESLENAGESSVLPMLRSVRSVLGLLYCTRMRPIVTPCAGVDHQIMLQLVHSSWILHLSCNKRRVAPIAALLSAALHPSVFSNLKMHETNGSKQGPLKWFIEKLLAEGEKSPRMIRLAALHLTGLWFLYPKTVKYYIKELKLLSQYGSVAFDEDFEAEVYENPEARTEVSFLAQNLDSELTEVFINTEMYARVSVAVLFYKLADLNDTRRDQNEDCMDSLYCGKMFLLELLDFAVTDKDLSKELYKKYSGVHRRKVRVWQMICILSHFVDENIVKEVTSKLHICLYRNNLPAVRQYMETFAINIYLKFPMLAKEQMVPIFYDYNMKPQAISSYVFIAANVIIHAKELQIQTKHLSDLIPPIIPFLTSHHHSLRGFTQLLVHYVLCKLWPALGSPSSDVVAFEKKCFEDLRSYLAENVDCVKLRASMEGFLDFFDPITSATPAGVFNARNEVSDFECVPMTLMEQVIDFLNDVRDDLRSSIAKDAIAIKNESLAIADSCESMEESLHVDGEVASLDASKEISLDFQKKITLYTHETKQTDSNTEFILGNAEFPGLLSEMEKEDFLLSSVVQSRNHAIEKIRGSCQEFILVASLIDRIPNLAGLARTCEVFKAAGLAIADASLVKDKQFQLISVTAEKWVPIIEVPVNSMKIFLEKKRREGFSILGLEQTANSTPLDQYSFPQKMVLVLGREKEGIPVDIIHVLDACVEIPQLGIIRSLNVHVSGAIALWEYTRQQRFKKP